MGKLGSREMTAASDLDLIVIYDFAADAADSDGRRPLPPALYYARLTQRLVAALTAPTKAGRLYDVDLQAAPLRPPGTAGDVACRLRAISARGGRDLGAHGADPRARRRGRRDAGARNRRAWSRETLRAAARAAPSSRARSATCAR